MKETSDKKKQNNTEKPLKAVGRGKAIFIVILCIILAVFVGGRRGLMNERKEALSYFTGENVHDGGKTDHHSEKDYVLYYIGERIDCAKNLITVANRYLSENDSLVKNVKSEIKDLTDNDNPSSCYKHNEKLTSACNSLFAKLRNVASEQDISMSQRLIDKMVSAQQKMGHLEYNAMAETFNKLISGFPTNLVSRLTFVKALPLFTD